MTTTMRISDLPRDLEEEILSRIPLKMMRAVRLTCKTWDTLSKNQSFVKKHAAKAQMFVLFMDYKLYLKSVVFNGVDVDPYTEPKGKLTCLNDSEQVEKISRIFQCEGLLLCILKDTLRLVVWNPYLAQTTRWIEPRLRKPCGLENYSYALGYSNESELSLSSHKILKFIDDFHYGHYYSWYEIYNFDTGLWKTLDFTSPHWRISWYHRGVSLKGNTYWISHERESRKTRPGYIICFDFTRERFGKLLPLPHWAWADDDSEFTSLSCVGEEKLAVLSQYDEASTVEIWITTKIEAEEVLWSKFLTVNMDTFADNRIAFTDGSFLIDEGKKLAMFFDKTEYNQNLRHTISIIGEDGRHFREVDLGEDGCVRKGDCWNHKILRFVDDLFYGGAFLLYEIYDFDTGLWKTLDFSSPHWRIASYHRGVSLKGNTYWICNERESRETRPGYIICFDFTRERFGQLLPLPRWAVDSEFTSLSCVGEEKLAVLSQYDEASTVEIWITTKIEAEEVLWSKFLTVNMDTFADNRIAFTDGSFLIDEGKKLAMFFDKTEYNQNLRHTISIIGEDGRHFREVDLGEDGCVRKGDCWNHKILRFVDDLFYGTTKMYESGLLH